MDKRSVGLRNCSDESKLILHGLDGILRDEEVKYIVKIPVCQVQCKIPNEPNGL